MIPKKIQNQFRLAFAIFALIIFFSYLSLLNESPFFDSLKARMFFVLMITSMTVFASLLENYIGWNKNSPKKLEERFKQITFLFSIPFVFLVLTNWGYTFFLLMIMMIPLGLSLVERIPVFHYIKFTKKKTLLTGIIFALIYFTAGLFYSFEFFEKETFYVFLISHMLSSIIANFLMRIKSIRKKINKGETIL